MNICLDSRRKGRQHNVPLTTFPLIFLGLYHFLPHPILTNLYVGWTGIYARLSVLCQGVPSYGHPWWPSLWHSDFNAPHTKDSSSRFLFLCETDERSRINYVYTTSQLKGDKLSEGSLRIVTVRDMVGRMIEGAIRTRSRPSMWPLAAAGMIPGDTPIVLS